MSGNREGKDRRRQEAVIAGIVRALGASLRSRRLYPPSHPSVRTPVEKCYADILPFFGDRGELVLAVSDGTLVFEGVPLFTLTSSLESFMERLVGIGAPGVIFVKGLRMEELEAFIRFLHETGEEGLPAEEIQRRLLALGIDHIRVVPPEDDETAAREAYNSALTVVVSVLDDVRNGRIPSGAESERAVKDMNGLLKRNRDAMLALTLIKNYDEYTYNHSVNVAVISLSLADAIGLGEAEKVEIGVAGLLHDVGKTQLALDLIRKPGRLTPVEFEEIKKHPDEGFVLLGKMSHIRPGSAYLVREHHMRLDRSGYPALDGEYRKHPLTHVIPVADTYDAVTTMRSYQRARTPLEALALLRDLAGKTLDADVVSAFARAMGPCPIGTAVRLGSMEVGIVVACGGPAQRPSRVSLVADAEGRPFPRPETVDLLPDGGARTTIVGTVNPLLVPSAVAATALVPPA